MTQEGRVLTFSYDYQAGRTFEVISRLQTSTTVRLLTLDDEETIPEISQPDEYTGHVIRPESAADGALEPTTLLFIRGGSISPGESATFGTDVSMFSSDLNLLSTTVE